MAIEKPAIEGGTPVRGDVLPYTTQWIGEEEIAAVVNTLKTVWITTGPREREFAEKFAAYAGAKHAVAVNSCTSALHISVAAAGAGPGDQVITTPLTFAATVFAITHNGAEPVFADIKEDTYNIDSRAIEGKITESTKALLPVHYGGNPADMDAIMETAGRHGLKVIEDAAHAAGAGYGGRKIGSIADMTCFSFHAVKNMTCIEGGAVTTDNPETARALKELSYFGINADAYSREKSDRPWHYDVVRDGLKCNMPDVSAAVGLVQLQKLDEFNNRRRELAGAYNEAFSGMDEIILPSLTPGAESSHHLYVIRIKEGALRVDRDRVLAALRAENILATVHYTPIYSHPYFSSTLGVEAEEFPVCERVARSIITLPLFPKMTDEDLQTVVDAVTRIIEYYRA